MEIQPDPSVIEEVIAIVRGGLGKAELEFVGSLVALIFWILRDGGAEPTNGRRV